MFNDLRYSLRMLVKNPGYTAFVVLTLALGIGATTAIFSGVNSVILNPLPMPDSDRYMQIGERVSYSDGKVNLGGVSPPVFEALRAAQENFVDLTWCDQSLLDRNTDDFVDQMMGFAVAPNFFTALGVKPKLGRTFASDEGEPEREYNVPKGDSVIVLSHKTWKSIFGGDPGAVGRVVELSRRHFTIIGVMPPDFAFPWGDARFWIPSQDPRVVPNVMTAPNCYVIVRLKPGVEQEQAQVLVDTIGKRLSATYSDPRRGYGAMWRMQKGLSLFVRPARLMFADNGQDLRQTLFGLFGAVVFILLIVCANVANLTLAKSEGRQQELAVRAALGAGRFRLVRQCLTESVVMSLLGGLAGLILALWGVHLLGAMIPDYMPRVRAIRIDRAALGFSTLLSVITGICFGLAPAWRVGRAKHVHDLLKQGGLNATTGLRGRWLRGSLVVAEVAMTLLLMVGAGLMVQSVVKLLRTDPGFKTDHLLQVYIQLKFPKYAGPDHIELKNSVLSDIHARLAALPGVTAVGIARGADSIEKYSLDGKPGEAPVELADAGCGVRVTDCFGAMGVPLIAGRHLDMADIGPKVGTVVVNQIMAQMCWPGQSAIGKTFRQQGGQVVYQVVGVVGDIHTYSLGERVQPTFYRPYHEFDYAGVAPYFVVRTQSDPHALIPGIRKALLAADPEMQMPSIGLFDDILYRSTQAQRTYMHYLLSFAIVGAVLSVIGIYGVLAYSVARRTREIGVRMALGAQRSDLLRMVMSEGARLVVLGLLIGLAAALGLTRFLQNQLYGVSPTDPIVLAVVVAVLLVVALMACYVPARRATRVDPMTALRSE